MTTPVNKSYSYYISSTNCLSTYLKIELKIGQLLKVGGRGAYWVITVLGQKLKEQITHIKELCKDIEVEIVGVSSTERNYYPTLIQLFLKLKKLSIKWQ